MARARWGDLPERLRREITDALGGEVVKEQSQTGGYTPVLASRLTLTAGRRVFCKAVPSSHPLAAAHRAEADAAAAMPSKVATPRLLWRGEHGGWYAAVFTDVDGRHPDLSPGSADVRTVVAALDALSGPLTPCPLSKAPPIGEVLGPVLSGWVELTRQTPPDLDRWALRHLGQLSSWEGMWVDHAGGGTLVHGDIRPDQLLVDEIRRVWVVDWSYPCRGAAWIDMAELAPHLILAGHSARAADEIVSATGALTGVPEDVVTSFAVAAAGYWALACRQEPPLGIGRRLRAFQASAADAALAWIRHRTGW